MALLNSNGRSKIEVRIDSALKNKLLYKAQQSGETMSEMIINLINDHLVLTGFRPEIHDNSKAVYESLALFVERMSVNSSMIANRVPILMDGPDGLLRVSGYTLGRIGQAYVQDPEHDKYILDKLGWVYEILTSTSARDYANMRIKGELSLHKIAKPLLDIHDTLDGYDYLLNYHDRMFLAEAKVFRDLYLTLISHDHFDDDYNTWLNDFIQLLYLACDASQLEHLPSFNDPLLDSARNFHQPYSERSDYWYFNKFDYSQRLATKKPQAIDFKILQLVKSVDKGEISYRVLDNFLKSTNGFILDDAGNRLKVD